MFDFGKFPFAMDSKNENDMCPHIQTTATRME